MCPEVSLLPDLPTICGTDTLDVSATVDSVFRPEVYTYEWSSGGDGTFVDQAGASANQFTDVMGYVPGEQDRQRGTVVLDLTSAAATLPMNCPVVADSIELAISNVDCGNYPWNGE